MNSAANAETRKDLETFMAGVIRRNPGESEFHQAVREVAHSVIPYTRNHEIYREEMILERLTEPSSATRSDPTRAGCDSTRR